MKLKKFLSKIIAFSMGLCMIAGSSTAFADSSMTLKAEADNEGNCVHLEWNAPDSENNYSYMLYSNNSIEGEFQSIPAKGTAKVLNVYPGKGNNAKAWMESPNSESENGYGKGLISVDEVNIDQFNSKPDAYLKDSKGNWKYDVVYFGAWNSNNGKDISNLAKSKTEEFIKDGGGVLFGHDTVTPGKNFWNFRNYLKVSQTSNYGGVWLEQLGLVTTVNVERNGLLTNYPYKLEGELTIPLSHSTYQYSTGDIWMRFKDSTTSYTDPSNFYLTTTNNCALIQLGNNSGQATPDEQKILANILFYLSQTTDATSWDDHKGQDLTPPTMPSINSASYDSANKKINVSYTESTDIGTSYNYYVEATNTSTKDKIKSNTESVTITSGLKGYSIVVDNNPDTVPSNNITTTDTNASVSVENVEAKDFYVHVAAVDKAGNVSEVSHYKYGYPVLSLTANTTSTTNEPVKITAKATSAGSKIKAIQTPEGEWIYNDTIEYDARYNGTYEFAAIDENGIIVTQSITISNIDDSKIILNIEPEKNKIFLQQDVEADLTIDNITEIAAEDVRIKYDNSKLQFLGFEEIEGIKIVKDDKNPGELRFILASQGIKNVVFQKKTLLKLHFKGIAEGQALVDVTKGRVSDGIKMERDLLDGQCGQAIITIEDYKDVNKDGEFTLLDLAIDGRYFGMNPADYPQYKTDIVENGQIDNEDLLQIGAYMLENPNYNF